VTRMTETTKNRQAPRSRFSPKPAAGLRLEERDARLLCDLFLHRFMARGQLEALYFTSTVRCNARLRQLFDYAYVKRYYLPAAPYGAQAVYSIGKNAVPLVAARLDMEADEVAGQYRRTRTPSFIEHTLEVVNLWLAFRDACAQAEGVEIERWLPETLCRHDYTLGVKGAARRKQEAFKPDAFVRLACGGRFYDYFIEVDLGHTSSRQFLGKLMTHQRYLESGLFTQIFGRERFKTLVVTTTGRRLKNLRALVEAQGSDLFWFATLDDARQSGITGRIWQVPFSGEFTALT
jgi:Replication-relaxation